MTVNGVAETRNAEQYSVEYKPSSKQEGSKPVPLAEGEPLGQDGTKLERTSTTQYIVQAGDTPEVIAKKLGLSGQEAKDFAAKVKENAQKSGKYHKFGFRAGETITLPGNHNAAIKNLKQQGSYHTDINSINNDFVNKTNERRGVSVQKTEASKPETTEETAPAESTQETESATKTGLPPAVKQIPGYKEPENTTPVELSDLKKDNLGRYIIPKGNYSIDSSEIPADDVRFVLADKDSNLVFKGKLDSKEESNFTQPVTADIIIRDSDPSSTEYESGDFEYKGGKYYFQGAEINPDEWDIQVRDFNNASTGKHAGIKIYAVKKDTVIESQDVKWTQRKVDISGPGSFYAEEVECPLSADVGKYEIGAIRKGSSGALSGDGNIQEMDIGNKRGYTLSAQNEVNIRNLKSGRVWGDNVNVADMRGGKYSAHGTVFNLYGGEFSSKDSNIVMMNGGHVLAANSIKVMQGGYLDLYKVRYSTPGEVKIENYIAGRIDSCDKAVVVIQNGFDKALLAQADSPLKEKRGGVISPKEPRQEVPVYNDLSLTKTADAGNTIVNWFKSWFS